jgi:hypothetical protein
MTPYPQAIVMTSPTLVDFILTPSHQHQTFLLDKQMTPMTAATHIDTYPRHLGIGQRRANGAWERGQSAAVFLGLETK